MDFAADCSPSIVQLFRHLSLSLSLSSPLVRGNIHFFYTKDRTAKRPLNFCRMMDRARLKDI